MILAIDIGEDRNSYGFSLIIRSIEESFGKIITYCSSKDYNKINIDDYPIVLCSFMFVQNYLDFLPTLRKLKVNFNPNKRSQFVIVGGAPISENPEPIADFFDIALIGESENSIIKTIKLIIKNNLNKEDALKDIYENVLSAYIPKFYKFEYEENFVKSYEGRQVEYQREDVNKSFYILNDYYRNKKDSYVKEYQFEYHRGCKRKCKFCSYAYLSNPYREINKDLIRNRIEEIYLRDKKPENKIIGIETSLFHLDIEILKLLKILDKLPNYSSACLSDLWTDKGLEIFNFMQNNSQVYMRYGIEGFSERERKLINKPIKNSHIYNLPMLLNKGTHLKFFMIVGLPTQTVEDIKEFEETLYKMSKGLNNYTKIDIFKTALNYKLNTGLNEYVKDYPQEIITYLEKRFRKKYNRLEVEIFKPQTKDYFREVNILSLAGRQLGNVLLEISDKKYNRQTFLKLCDEKIEVEKLFYPYPKDKKFYNCFITY